MKKHQYNSKNIKGKKFVNTESTFVMKPGTALTLLPKYFKKVEERKPKKQLGPVYFKSDIFSVDRKINSVTWLGHSSILIQLEGLTILTDPAWRNYASPIQGIGPKRFFSSPINIQNLPQIDYVLISHDHYDHLDKKIVKELGKREVKFICPLGVGMRLINWGIEISKIEELDWWEDYQLNDDVKLIATPSRHFSGRGLRDRDKTLWCSFAIIGKTKKIFFGADSGYFDGFKKIGELFGPFDLTMLEIGASSPYWPDIHMGPEKAMRAHIDLKGNLLLPIHWGTYNLALHPWKEPVETILTVAKVYNQKLLLPAPGVVWEIADKELISNWWKGN